MANIATPRSLQDLLVDVLPKDVPFTFYHYSTPPTKSSAVFNAPPHRKPERTYCESHLLAVSITPKAESTTGASDELLILAIEVLIYTTKQLTTIFVSKADSTGYIAALNLPRAQAGSPLKAICGTFVSWLAHERQREGKKLVVSLFARSQDQYLFPASIENKDKHVLDDRGLVKWWCKVLDPLIKEYAEEEEKKPLVERLADANHVAALPGKIGSSKASTTAKGYLVIPGFDPYDILRYTPAPTSGAPRRWVASHPLLQIAPHAGAPPRCLVPHFPDDPKSRFLDELDGELPDSRTDDMSQQGGTPSRSNGQWKSVKTLEQFWEMMAFRQECSSGRIVGFMWVVINPPNPSIPEEDEEVEPSQSQSVQESQGSIAPPISPLKKKKSALKKPRRRKVNTESGPIPLILPRIKSSASNLSVGSAGSGSATPKLPPESSPFFTWPATSRGTVLLSSTAYDRAHEMLLQQNFATRTAAARSTKRWKDEVAVLAAVEKWGWTVSGKKELHGLPAGPVNGSMPTTLLGARKKRKPEESIVPASQERDSNGTQVLGEGLVRKKPKVEETAPVADSGSASSVNTLGAGLVRKKPKN